MHKKRLTILFKSFSMMALLIINVAGSQIANAQVPLMINYQGKIEMTGVPYNGPGYFKFSLINDATSPTSNYWTNDGSIISAGAAPSSAVSLPVTEGLFTVKLGDTNLSNMTGLAASIFSNSTMYLRVWFSADGIVFERLDPDRQLVSVPYAMRAEKANSVEGTDVVSTTAITNNTITNADINTSAAISASKIDTSSATNLVSSIVAGSGVSLSPASGVGDVTITVTGSGAASDVVCTNCVETADITDGTITVTDLAFDPIEETELDTKAELEAQLTDVTDIAMADGDVYTGAHDFGGATSLEMPNSATPTTDATGELALDTSITDHQPLFQYFDGTKNMSIIAIDTAELPALDNEIIKYDAATDKFVLEADAGGGGSGDITDVGDCTTGECFTSAATNPGILEFEGTTNDGIEVILQAADATVSDKTITLPDASGTVAVSASSPLALSAAGDVSLGTVDISSNTNLTVSAPVTLTDDDIGLNQNAGTDVTADLEEEGQVNTTVVTGNASASTGQVLRSTGANAAAWGALDLADSDAVTGTLDVSTNTNLTVSAPITLTNDDIGLNQNAGTDVTADLEEEGQVNTTAVTGNAADDQLLVGTGASALGYETLPDCDDSAGQHLNYDTTGNTFSCGTTSSGGGSTAWDDIVDPDASTTIDFTTFTQTIDLGMTDTGGPKNGLILDVTGLGAGSTNVVALEITTPTDDDVNYIPLEIRDDSGAANDLLFQIDSTGAIATGTIPVGSVTGTTTDLSVDLIEETELDTKAELETQLTDVTDIAMADGDVYTGVHDFGGATSLEIPNSTAPALTADGQIALETDADAVNIQAGSNSTGGIPSNTDVAIPLIQQKDITLMEPDQINSVSDAIPFFAVDAYNYPNGITITAIRLATSASSTLPIDVEKWDDPVGSTVTLIDSITTSGNTEVTETTISFATVEAGNYVFLNLDSTDVDWAKVTIWYYVND